MSALIMEYGKRELLLDRIKEHKYFPPKLLNVYILFYELPWWLRWLKKKKKSACNAGDLGSISGLGRPGKGNGKLEIR